MCSAPQTAPYSESLLVHFKRIGTLKNEALRLPSVDLSHHQLNDLEMLLNRAFFPLEGYLGRADYESVLDTMRLADGTLWPMPVCLDLGDRAARAIQPGQPLALRDPEGFMLAVLHVQDLWQPDKRREALAVYGTDDETRHPGVRRLYRETAAWYAGGRLEGLHLPQHYDFPELRLPPSEAHRQFTQRGWRNVIGFQTSSRPHCAHREMVLRAAREAGASIFIMPELGHPGQNDADHFTLVRCYQHFAQSLPRNMTALGLIPYTTRMAGPREALWQAIVRGNYGCTHVTASEDQCDPFAANGHDRFYPPGAALELLREHRQETGVEVIEARSMVYVAEKAQYLDAREVEPGMNVMQISSGELMRRLEHGLEIPDWFSLPRIVEELRKAYPPRHSQGFTIMITGLSGAGKSTLAKVLFVKFMEMNDRPVTLLDGDIVRRNLSSELTFSREHRNLNVTRIGFVASEITKNRGIAICAPIAPYEESRQANRELISHYGGYVEIFMATPLEVCEQRDRKGLYAKARAGIVKGVTGIDDPYVPPSAPDITIDTTELTPSEAAQEVLLYLEEQGYVR